MRILQRLLVVGDHLRGDLRRHFAVVVELEFEAAAALRDRTKVAGVALDLGERYLGLDDG